MKKHLEGLNEKQKEAVLHKDGPLLIVAGAGAGKTKTITHRIVNLIESGVLPQEILAVTFTNKAAKEMKERISQAIHNNKTISKNIAQADEPSIAIHQETNMRGFQNNFIMEPFVSTFHSLGVHIIKENSRILGIKKHFTILDESDSNSLIKEALKELSLDVKQYEPRKIKGIISREKGNFTKITDFREKAENTNSYLNKIVGQVWEIYEKKKHKENSLDFDDLILKSTLLLKENKEVREKYQNQFKYIHIDEYQDTNEAQYMMTKLLSEGHKNICVVGDADQNIYSWRGANLKNILSFEKDYPNAKIILLEENYRSTQNILEFANKVIKKNKYRPEKNLFTKNKIGEKISLYEAIDGNDEAEYVAIKILEILDCPFHEEGQNVILKNIGSRDGDEHSKSSTEDLRVFQNNILSNIAILYRANFQSRALEEYMLKYNIPYQVLGTKFFERKEIKDTLAYLRASLNPESLSDIKRIINFPKRGIGKLTLLKIFSGERENLPIKIRVKINNFYETLEKIKEKIEKEKASEVIKYAVKISGIEEELKNGDEEDKERLENIKELVTLALKYDNLNEGKGIEKLLEDASLSSDQDSLIINEKNKDSSKKNKDGVKLMTVHASKGLEFDYVFITGLEDGLFPYERDEGEDEEEERRLFYVAITRAKKKIFLSFANFRTIFGSRQINTPSEFLNDIPHDILEKGNEESGIKTIYI